METQSKTLGVCRQNISIALCCRPDDGGESHTDDNELLIALRHPLRREILRAMAEQDPISPRQISDELHEPLSNVSYHVRVLADCGAVALVDTDTGARIDAALLLADDRRALGARSSRT